MGLTVVPGNMIQDGTVTDSNFDNTTITSADMALDPRDADNYTSGSVPLAQLGNVPAADLTGLDDDIALLGFKAAANGSLAKYNLLDQTVDAFEDASGVDAGSSTNEIRDSSKYYSGTAAASGGTITTHGAYTVHSFITAGNENFVVGAAGNVAVLVVAAGGGGGTTSGGGGGGGGLRTSASHAVTAQTYTVTVGAGGAGGTYNAPGDPSGWYEQGVNGGNSVFDTITSAGGGGGMGYGDPWGSSNGLGGSDGGSGGGGGTTTSAPDTVNGGAGNTPSTSPAQGFAGGDGGFRGYPGAPNANWYAGGGGGGGAGAVGVDSASMTNPNYGGTGGVGATNDYRTGSNVTYAGGGGAAGGRHYPNSPETYGPNGAGGGGGGGTGAAHTSPMNGQYNPANNGTANTGGGGGGTPGSNWGGYGGSGIVVVRYPTGDISAYENMTLVSNLTAAQAAPTKGDIVFTYTNGAGTAVINTNITAEISADNGSTWTLFSGLTSQGTTGGHTIVTAHDQTISSTITSPWNMRYRIKTLVQSASMQTRIQAVSLGWS